MRNAFRIMFMVIDLFFRSIGKLAEALYTSTTWIEAETRDLLNEEDKTRVLAELAAIKAEHAPKSK